MPNLVAYLHVRLNLNNADDEEIYRNLTRLPEGERSRTVRAALLTYFKGEITRGAKPSKRTKIRHVEPESGPGTKTVSAIKMEAATPESGDSKNQPEPTTKRDSEAALNDMLSLIR